MLLDQSVQLREEWLVGIADGDLLWKGHGTLRRIFILYALTGLQLVHDHLLQGLQIERLGQVGIGSRLVADQDALLVGLGGKQDDRNMTDR